MSTQPFIQPIETTTPSTAGTAREAASARKPRPRWVSLAKGRRTTPVQLSWIGLVPPSMGR
jgi:hypothetical protein